MTTGGPRPTLANRPFEEIPPENRKRYEVRPGITGYAQAYFRNSITQQEKFKHDAYYVENLSFALDLKVLVQTVKSVFKHENIYVSTEGAPAETATASEPTAQTPPADNTGKTAAEHAGQVDGE